MRCRVRTPPDAALLYVARFDAYDNTRASFYFRDNIFLGITYVVPNSGQNWQAGQCGTHIAKLPLPPAAGEAISLLEAAPPNPFEQLRTGAGCAFLRNAFCRTGGPPEREKRSTLFLLTFCLFLFFLFIETHQTVHVGLDGQQLFHIVTRFAVVGVCRFFLSQQRGIFGL